MTDGTGCSVQPSSELSRSRRSKRCWRLAGLTASTRTRIWSMCCSGSTSIRPAGCASSRLGCGPNASGTARSDQTWRAVSRRLGSNACCSTQPVAADPRTSGGSRSPASRWFRSSPAWRCIGSRDAREVRRSADGERRTRPAPLVRSSPPVWPCRSSPAPRRHHS